MPIQPAGDKICTFSAPAEPQFQQRLPEWTRANQSGPELQTTNLESKTKLGYQKWFLSRGYGKMQKVCLTKVFLLILKHVV